jgi:hypothetical protein
MVINKSLCINTQITKSSVVHILVTSSSRRAGCAKDVSCTGCVAGAACAAERRRFIAAVLREDDRVRAAAGAGRDTYSALYNLHWRAQAHRLLRQDMLDDKAAAEKTVAEMLAEPEPEPELDHSSPRSWPAPTPEEANADSCIILQLSKNARRGSRSGGGSDAGLGAEAARMLERQRHGRL